MKQTGRTVLYLSAFGVGQSFVAALSSVAATTTNAFVVPVYFDGSNDGHSDVKYHPEQPERIFACVEALDRHRNEGPQSQQKFQLINVAETSEATPTGQSELHPKLADINCEHQPFSASELAHAKDMLLHIHAEDIVIKLEETCRLERTRLLTKQQEQSNEPPLSPRQKFLGYIDPDTYVTTETFDVCLRATAAWIRAVQQGRAMALTRPPGHHATRALQNGFCLFNFAAATVSHVLAHHPDQRIAVLDWDVHYGQGVAEIVLADERVRYVSIHQSNAFPFQGNFKRKHGKHENVFTLPMPAGTTWEKGYEGLFDQALDFVLPVGNNDDDWAPDVVIVCGGYDALGSDELASVELNAKDFGRMTRKLQERIKEMDSEMNREHPIRMMVGLEGGYQLGSNAGGGNLQQAVIETLDAMV